MLERGGEYFWGLWRSLKDSDRYFLWCLISRETPTDQNPKIVRKLVKKEVLHQLLRSHPLAFSAKIY
ncbi:hypothetical protein [Coleofasciculus sp. H7-2]|uniref:hypothetical protein n=1 Tax=Coleofasciculus sp. H7-2 TaxID=3351545 RepID=UPI003671F9CD